MKPLKFFLPLVACMGLVACSNNTEANKTNAEEKPAATANTSSNSEDAIKAREKIMKEWGKASKTMGGMIKDPSTFNLEAFKAEAEKLKTDPWVHFAEGTKGGESKDEVWTKPAEFQAEIDKYKAALTAFDTALQSAKDVEGVKATFADVGATCKSCHKVFKAD